MKTISKLKLTAIGTALCCLSSCAESKSDDSANKPSPQDLTAKEKHEEILAKAPQQYAFSSRFDNDQSSVAYSGQIFRHILMKDLKTTLSNLERGSYNGSEKQLFDAIYSYLSYQSDNTSTAPLAINGESYHNYRVKLEGNPAPEVLPGLHYDDISPKSKDLLSKLAGNDGKPLGSGDFHGWDNVERPEQLLVIWVNEVVKNTMSDQPLTVEGKATNFKQSYLSAEGHDYVQLIEKLLHGALSFSQATRDYLSTHKDGKGLLADNTTAVEGKPYTALEHHWDEGFGYFGAARDYLLYTDEQIKKGYSLDTNGDGSIDLLSEKNFGLSINSAKRDIGVQETSTPTDFTKDAMVAFIKGRYLIQAQPEGYLGTLKELRGNAISAWEKTIAATVVHYASKTQKIMDLFGNDDYKFNTHAKYWSELKGFAFAFQFNPESPMSLEQSKKLHELIGTKPVLSSASQEEVEAYKANLDQVKEILKTTYGFSEEQTATW